jgi:hypothetical protein
MKDYEEFVAAEDHIGAEPCIDLGSGYSKKFILRHVSNHRALKV